MRRVPRFTEELLIVNSHINSSNEALAWRPFPNGNTIGQIITAHNLRCEGELKEKLPGSFADCVREVAPALTVKAFSHTPALQFMNRTSGRNGLPKIILLALDTLDDGGQMLSPLLDRLANSNGLAYLVQIGRHPSAASRAHLFNSRANILIIQPEVLTEQAELEAFLHAMRKMLSSVWEGIALNPFDARCLDNVFKEPYVYPGHGQFMKPGSRPDQIMGHVCRTYNDALAQMAAEARDVAMSRALSEAQAVNLGRTAALQEFLLSVIVEKVRAGPANRVSTRPIRQSINDIPVDRSVALQELQPVNLLVLKLAAQRRQPTLEQCQAMEALGFEAGALTVVRFEEAGVWSQISLLGDLVTHETLAAELPAWERPAMTRPGLSEKSLGLRVEESFYRRQDRKYDRRGRHLNQKRGE